MFNFLVKSLGEKYSMAQVKARREVASFVCYGWFGLAELRVVTIFSKWWCDGGGTIVHCTRDWYIGYAAAGDKNLTNKRDTKLAKSFQESQPKIQSNSIPFNS